MLGESEREEAKPEPKGQAWACNPSRSPRRRAHELESRLGCTVSPRQPGSGYNPVSKGQSQNTEMKGERAKDGLTVGRSNSMYFCVRKNVITKADSTVLQNSVKDDPGGVCWG